MDLSKFSFKREESKLGDVININFIGPILIVIAIVTWMFFFKEGGFNLYLMVAAILGLYMAMNIGANDVANNMGPAVGSKALTLAGAILIAAIFEASGALIAGGDVVNTVKGDIIDSSILEITTREGAMNFIYIMLATLLGSALWINIATFFKAPVSATHSIIGGLVGAGISAYGFEVIKWGKILEVSAGWVISPIMGGLVASLLLISINKTIINKKERSEAAKKWIPVFIGIMIWTFSSYLLLKGLKKIIHIDASLAISIGGLIALLGYIALIVYIRKHGGLFKNSKKSINKLFNIPLIFSAALLSFAHGANDVANAIGPLAAINDVIQNGNISVKTGIPIWVMVIGAIGISAGLAIFGSRLIKTVGGEITKLNQIRAYCVALAAAITVIIASGLGLPVSSTHIAIGGIFGIGLMRERMKRLQGKDKEYIKKNIIGHIVLAWVVTLPVAGLISGIIYLALNKFL